MVFFKVSLVMIKGDDTAVLKDTFYAQKFFSSIVPGPFHIFFKFFFQRFFNLFFGTERDRA